VRTSLLASSFGRVTRLARLLLGYSMAVALLAAPGCGGVNGVDFDHPPAASDPTATGGASAVEGAADVGTPFYDASSRRDALSLPEGGPPLDAASDAVVDSGQVPEAGPPGSSIGCAGHGFVGQLMAFDFSTQPGNETGVPATSLATGVTAGALQRAPALTAALGDGSINSTGWPTTTTADSTRYYTFTVTPDPGCTLSLSSLGVATQASSTGPTRGDVATSVDSFADHTEAPAGTGTITVSLTASAAAGIEVRIYGFRASGSIGTYRLDNTLTLYGAIQ
jgi:hypothetical protein